MSTAVRSDIGRRVRHDIGDAIKHAVHALFQRVGAYRGIRTARHAQHSRVVFHNRLPVQCADVQLDKLLYGFVAPRAVVFERLELPTLVDVHVVLGGVNVHPRGLFVLVGFHPDHALERGLRLVHFACIPLPLGIVVSIFQSYLSIVLVGLAFALIVRILETLLLRRVGVHLFLVALIILVLVFLRIAHPFSAVLGRVLVSCAARGSPS
mmetsp:Transcript_11773/g.27638  ORF Transcript_11773/g.27638 Transcript_11773/m.27638 type:complete len:209 (+) Transcript_11773:429-1055(+)